MPINWVCDPKDFPFTLSEWDGAKMEWSWRHQRLKLENFHHGEWIRDPIQILYAANQLYPGKPNTHGLKGFFFETLNWYWHEPSKTLRLDIHLSFYASSGEPTVTAASLQEDVDDLLEQGSSTQAEELH